MEIQIDEREIILQDECLRLSSEGLTLREIKKYLENIHGENKGTNTITKWIKEASIRKYEAMGYEDFKQQKVLGMSELEEVQRDIKKLLLEKKFEVEFTNHQTGEKYIKEVPFSAMSISTLMKTLIDVIDRKNDIRGLNSKAIQLQLNQYNNDIHVSDEELTRELGNTNTELLEELKDFLQKSKEVVEINGDVIEVEPTETSGDGDPVHEVSSK